MKLFIILLPLLAFGITSGRETVPFSFIIILIMGLYIFLKEHSLSFDAAASTLIVFFIIAVFSVVINLIAPGKFHLSSYFADPMYMKDFKQIVMLMLMILHFLILQRVMKQYNVSLLENLLWFFVLIAFVTAVYSIYQFFALQHDWPLTDILRTSKSYSIIRGKELSNWLGLPRARAFMPESSFWGAFLLIPISILLPLSFEKRDIRPRFFLIVFITALLLSFSRTGWFGFGVISLYFLYARFRTNKKLMSFVITYIPVLVIALAIFFLIMPILRPEFYTKLTRFSDRSAFLRFSVQKESFLLFLEHPVIGIGWGNTSYYIHSLVTYNLYLQILLESGILGFMFFIFFLYQIWHKLMLLERKTKSYLSSGPLSNVILGLKLAFIAILTIWINIPAYNFSYTWFILSFICVFSKVAADSLHIPVEKTEI